MALFDFNHPFFKPLWIRVATVVVTGGWAIFEYASGAVFWAMLFGAVAAASAYGFFIDFNPRDDVDPPEKDKKNG